MKGNITIAEGLEGLRCVLFNEELLKRVSASQDRALFVMTICLIWWVGGRLLSCFWPTPDRRYFAARMETLEASGETADPVASPPPAPFLPTPSVPRSPPVSMKVPLHQARVVHEIHSVLETPGVTRAAQAFVERLREDSGQARRLTMVGAMESAFRDAAQTYMSMWGSNMRVEKRLHFVAQWMTMVMDMARSQDPELIPTIADCANMCLDSTASYFKYEAEPVEWGGEVIASEVTEDQDHFFQPSGVGDETNTVLKAQFTAIITAPDAVALFIDGNDDGAEDYITRLRAHINTLPERLALNVICLEKEGAREIIEGFIKEADPEDRRAFSFYGGKPFVWE